MTDATTDRPEPETTPVNGEASARLEDVRPADPDAAPDPDEIVVEDDSEPATRQQPTSPLAGERVIYRDAPVPPRPHSNRVVGALLAGAGALLFAVLYALAAAVVLAAFPGAFGGLELGAFLSDAAFWVPVLLFAVGFVLVVLLLNRAPWWAHVAGSLLVAAVVYLGTIGIALLLNLLTNEIPGAGFGTFAAAPFILLATVLAREVSIWVGFLIARRGGRLKTRNAEERAAFEREHGMGTANGSTTARP